MTFCGNPLSRSLSGVKRTSMFALQMPAYDPKRTSRNSAGATEPAHPDAAAAHNAFSIAGRCPSTSGVAIHLNANPSSVRSV
jgi:hypothetical protein